MNLGIDVGSTTVKVVLLDSSNEILYKDYKRHNSEVDKTVIEMINDVSKKINSTDEIKVTITGSAGMGMADVCEIPFVQEVFATQLSVKEFVPTADVAIELGGEDAKIIFFTGAVEYRMNGSCAGGTGSFIDQMATLLNVDLDELDELSLQYNKLYTIATRCGVFAKSDIQPLLNQGANKKDLAASIYQSVVEQTIGGLAQGREIKGNVVFLGGPLTFAKGLRDRFIDTLKLTSETAILHENSAYFVALGAGLYSRNTESIIFSEFVEKFKKLGTRKKTTNALPPLFKDKEDYQEFIDRHNKNSVEYVNITEYKGEAYLGIDVGSTTTKLILMDKDNNILYKFYNSNQGNPIDLLKEQLLHIYSIIGEDIKIVSSAVVGYGEELAKAAFGIDNGTVETVAHYLAARHFNKDVDFIIDIGGQDIKCFAIKDGAVDNIMLNEACSSGCGSFIQTYANSMGHNVENFSKFALFAKNPIELGSRCTVFMNSSIKQAQKEGVSVEDISAGLAYSVVQNAVYKVIRVQNPEALGKNIVVQGGTFLNDAILRSFELELNKNVVRPSISGLMGAYGACLYAKMLECEKTTLISKDSLQSFVHKTQNINCRLCTNYCSLSVNTFSDKGKYISGNRCERPVTGGKKIELPNMYAKKLDYILNLENIESTQKVAIPLALNMYEMLPFWQGFFNELGIEVVTSNLSTRETFKKGQHTIPSDTVCYPAKLAHGHILQLLEDGHQNIFYPCMTYNLDEGLGDNHYNCPVVAYYPELLNSNISRLNEVNYMYPHFGLHNPKTFEKKAYTYFKDKFNVSKQSVKAAVERGFLEYNKYKDFIRLEGEKAIAFARENNKKIMVVSGRPYHIDPEVNHGIDELIKGYDLVLISEDCISHLEKKEKLTILNQWTYHSRMFSAAKHIANKKDMEFIQLVSFGCGIDAITSDELKRILSKEGKIYTQLKIDEITNLGTVKIRIRSLLAALLDKEKQNG
ncbi:MAG: acyl-CoA dehydratase activase [Lachnospirales bacterium]